MNDTTTAFAGRVVIIVARIAKRHAVRTCIIVCPDSVTTVFAGDSFAVVAIITEYVTVKSVVVIVLDCCPAAAADGAGILIVVHSVVLLNILLPEAW